MSLNIITNIKKVDKNRFIDDVEMIDCIIQDNEYCRKVISEIDQGSYLGYAEFLDRFGYKLYSDSLSTTSKAYLCLDRFSDKIINFIQVGRGSGDLLLMKSQGAIYIPGNRLKSLFSSLGDRSVDIVCDDRKFNSYYDLVDYLEEEY